MSKKRAFLAVGIAVAAALVYVAARVVWQRFEHVEMPYADILETANQKWDLHFLDDWSVWEKRVDRHIKEFYKAQKRRKKSHEIEYFKWRYHRLWAMDEDLDDLPLPASLEPEGGISENSGGRIATGGGKGRSVEPAMIVDLREGKVLDGGLVDGSRSFDGGFSFVSKGSLDLTDEEHYRAMYRGLPPVQKMEMYAPLYRTVYVESVDPLNRSIGELPPELDPAEPFKQMDDADLQLAVRQLEQIVNRPTPHQEKTLRAASQDPVDKMYVADLFNGIMRAWRERRSAWADVSMTPLQPASAGVEQAKAVKAAAKEPTPPPEGTPYLYADAYASPVRAVGKIHGKLNGPERGGSVTYKGRGIADSSIAFTDNLAAPPIVETYSYLGKKSYPNRDGDEGYGEARIRLFNWLPRQVKHLNARTYCPWDRFWLWLNDPARYSISSEASAEIQDAGDFAAPALEREARYP